MSGGEMRRYHIPDVFQFNRGQVVDKDGCPIFGRLPCASDAVIVELNYRTGRAWLEPANIGFERWD